VRIVFAEFVTRNVTATRVTAAIPAMTTTSSTINQEMIKKI